MASFGLLSQVQRCKHAWKLTAHLGHYQHCRGALQRCLIWTGAPGSFQRAGSRCRTFLAREKCALATWQGSHGACFPG